MTMEESFKAIIEESASAFAKVNTMHELYEVKSKYIGKKGKLSAMFSEMKNASVEDKKKIGSLLNETKLDVEKAYNKRREEIETILLEQSLLSNKCDVTIPHIPHKMGRINLINKTSRELFNILKCLGFSLVDGPEIEDSFHVFDALNIDEDHPARQMHDTFYLNKMDKNGDRMVLRTHTSSVQIRAIKEHGVPIKIISCGKVYRSDWDMTHTPMFHQIEGLYIDTDVNMGHLKYCLRYLLEKFFNREIDMRFRPSFFPFTEPSAEVDINYSISDDGKIKIGTGNKMMEVLGCGMVHPNVLKRLNIDTEKYSGFAFGIGVERLAMLKFGVPDLRSFFSD